MCAAGCDVADKKATLIAAREDVRSGELYYIIEYTGVLPLRIESSAISLLPSCANIICSLRALPEPWLGIVFAVETPRWARHNFAVFVSRDDTLYTFNAQSSRSQWDKFQAQFSAMVESFSLLPTSPESNTQDASYFL
jgi:hypothetical protein